MTGSLATKPLSSHLLNTSFANHNSQSSIGRAIPIRPSAPEPPRHSLRLESGGVIRRPSGAVIDLRRHTGLDTATVLCQRARHLVHAERVLVESVFRDGHSLYQLAQMHVAADRSSSDAANTSPKDRVRITARRLGRNLKRAVRRMTSPLFVFVAARLERAEMLGDSAAWPTERRRVGELVVLHGKTVTAAARTLGIGLHRARAHLRAIEAMHAGAAS